ncbi:glutathione S-transferase [Ensifer adhaerens]|nr:glutathione S-transferase [Ensifer adhaerens]
MTPILYGASYSVYVRIVRLCLHEKAVQYEQVPVDIFSDAGTPSNYWERHPFGRIPAFEHDGFSVYESGAIARYIDEAFQGIRLQPVDVRQRARINQIISIADNYVYPNLVWGVYVERVSKPLRGETTDQDKFKGSLEKSRLCLETISALMGGNDWLAGQELSLADLWLAPMIDYFLLAPEGLETLRDYAALADWWSRINSRESMLLTKSA